MAVDPRNVEIQRPCPVDLDATGMRGTGRSWHCSHCDKAVHVLSRMTEREAEAFLRENAQADVCISYAMSPTGEIRFLPEPSAIVPVASLARRRVAQAAAVGLGIALAACTPHEGAKVAPQVVDVVAPLTSAVTVPTPPLPRPRAQDIIADGQMARRDVQLAGGLRAPRKVTVPEPCDAPEPRIMTKRGMAKRIDR